MWLQGKVKGDESNCNSNHSAEAVVTRKQSASCEYGKINEKKRKSNKGQDKEVTDEAVTQKTCFQEDQDLVEMEVQNAENFTSDGENDSEYDEGEITEDPEESDTSDPNGSTKDATESGPNTTDTEYETDQTDDNDKDYC